LALAASLLCATLPAQATPEQYKAMKDFVDCLNQKIGAGNQADIASTLQCIPSGCTMTLTMSEESAQPACSSGAGNAAEPRCQMPRVIFNCPGPPAFIPSYTLCPDGVDSIEIGIEISRQRRIRMLMGDVTIPAGPYTPIKFPDDIVSMLPDTKGCNACHDKVNQASVTKGPEFSYALDTFGSFAGTDLAKLVIDTNEPGRVISTGPGATPQTLASVCGCIDDAVNNDLHPLFHNQVVQRLCEALVDYQATRGWK
jgi:hypothetical protein